MSLLSSLSLTQRNPQVCLKTVRNNDATIDHFSEIPLKAQPAGPGGRGVQRGTGKYAPNEHSSRDRYQRLTPQKGKPGVESAPLALIEAGLIDQLRDDLGYEIYHDEKVHFYESILPGSDPDHRGMKKPRTVSAVTRQLSQQVYDHAKEGRLALTLGGDHSIAIGSISGSAKAIRERLGREVAVIWVDAHADINTPELSPSGNIHGMPMAFLTRLAREEKEDIFGWLQDDQIVNARKLVYIGLRDVDRGEKKLLRDNGIKAFSMHDIDR